jgi:hypothetical protein
LREKEKILYKKIKIYYNIIDCRQANHGASPFLKKASSACFLCAFLSRPARHSPVELRDPQGELRDPQGECLAGRMSRMRCAKKKTGECLACAVLKKKEGKKNKKPGECLACAVLKKKGRSKAHKKRSGRGAQSDFKKLFT